jgi:hypothetical protein
MCKKLLANPVLEDYTIETIEAPVATRPSLAAPRTVR